MLSPCALLIAAVYVTLNVCTGTDAYSVTSAHHLQLRNYTYTFEEYIQEYGKIYEDPAEYEMRRSLFEQRLEEVRIHNEDPERSRLWRKGMNPLSDKTQEELNTMHGYDRAVGHYRRHLANQERVLAKQDASKQNSVNYPDILDWRNIPGVLTSTKEQGNCGSCWAFAGVSTIESRWYLAAGRTMDLSVQEVVSCTPNPHKCGGTGGCSGGTAELVFDYVKQQGSIPSEWTSGYMQYYNNDTVKCENLSHSTKQYAPVNDTVRVESNSLSAVLEAVQSGPVAVNVDASLWHTYESGIFSGCDPKNVTINHVVQLVGYGQETIGTEVHYYWIIRNSWGIEVGEKGYFRIAREIDTPVCGTDYKPSDGTGCEGGPSQVTVCGMCGILYDVSYPTFAHSDSHASRPKWD